jgi:pyruvate,orthophosphate dikinase
MRVLRPDLRGGGTTIAIESNLAAASQKLQRLEDCARLGMRLPETIVIDLGPLMAATSEATLDYRVLSGVLAAGASMFFEQGFDSGAPVAFRRLLGGSSVCPPALDIPLESVMTADGAKDIFHWLRWHGKPGDRVHSFLVQRMRPSLADRSAWWGSVCSRRNDGRFGLSGFVIAAGDRGPQSSRVVSYERSHIRQSALGVLLEDWARHVERLARRPSRVVFGVTDDQLYLLSVHAQGAPGWMTARVLTELVAQQLMTADDAVMSIDPDEAAPETGRILNPQAVQPIAVGTPEARGVVTTGRAWYGAMPQDPKDPCIVIRESLGPADALSISRSVGVIAARAGASSHMVVLARGLGKAVLTGVFELAVDTNHGARVGVHDIAEGEWLTVDEPRGILYRGRADIAHERHAESGELIRWATSPEVQLLVNADSASEVLPEADGIGLCRSERHVPTGVELDQLECPGHQRAGVLQSVAESLEALLRVARGRVVHYRLLDGGDCVRGSNRTAQMRGVRWGIASGFYEVQIQAVADVARRVANDDCPVDLVILAPFVSVPSEATWLADRVRSVAGSDRRDPLRVRVGCMIETPAGASYSREFATAVDVLCVGTNDLTEQVWGVSRDEGGELFARYAALGLWRENPFTYIDMPTVGSLIRFVTEQATRCQLASRVVMCGEHASVAHNARFWSELGRPTFSARASALGPMRLAMYQEMSASKGRRRFDQWPESTTRAAHRQTFRQVSDLVRVGGVAEAREIAWKWAQEVSIRYGLTTAANWKFFKRDLAARWFGKNESRRFLPGWLTEEVVAYAEALRGAPNQTRFSVFPSTIACHAVSEVLPRTLSGEEWARRIDKVDRNSAIEVFQEQSSKKLCFRAVLAEDVVRVEAGIGQAMYVFEQERGRHPVLAEQLYPSAHDLSSSSPPLDALRDELKRFVVESGDIVAGTMLAIEADLGCGWLGIEGYYAQHQQLVVCDIDLPFDLAFHQPV